ncbi:bifunctional nuclease in basal defense response1 [Striga asiatica]|uniref:Bifunctional nuclease in basal defense response1 n=1 Tax=Striga asiatica TaxID=4170 RepID=A0A5A7P3X9_STRAF|nr:bifunctional nuclease in basal defense response1 [Striga asiatica]
MQHQVNLSRYSCEKIHNLLLSSVVNCHDLLLHWAHTVNIKLRLKAPGKVNKSRVLGHADTVNNIITAAMAIQLDSGYSIAGPIPFSLYIGSWSLRFWTQFVFLLSVPDNRAYSRCNVPF